MSHCTKFDFSFSDEQAIVKAFRKVDVKCSTEMVCEFHSGFSKQVLGKLGYLGSRQFRAICGRMEPYQLFLCRVEANRYELFVEKGGAISADDETRMKRLAEDFRKAYIGVAVDEVVAKLEKGNMPCHVEVQDDKYLIRFGPMGEYSLSVVFDNGQLVEEVDGIKGDFCTKLTEDIENILSHPEAELRTEWKQEYELQTEDRNIQVLELSF